MKNKTVLSLYLLMKKNLSMMSILSIYEMMSMKTNFCYRLEIASNSPCFPGELTCFIRLLSHTSYRALAIKSIQGESFYYDR